eukprot:TRINITY_DN12022_c1_g1_i3.p1 TRINITY_DN12022_c1_g1~~TRINITY_DN12022_c1_g1_i3.p1  ORF type:complete len:436 (+),score=68.24 TRINITY_DN12022_c1_g1_i3:450-1757(+)
MPSTTEIIKHPLADPWTQEELPYLLTLPVYITLIGVLLLLLVIIARCVCCGCCVPSRDHWWFTEPFLGSINADVYVDTAQHLGRQPRGVISTVIHTVSIVLLWSLVANIFDWTSYRDATPVFLMTAGPARADAFLKTLCPPTLSLTFSDKQRVVGTTLTTPFWHTVRIPLRKTWAPSAPKDSGRVVDICVFALYDTQEQFDQSEQSCLVNLVKRGAMFYVEYSGLQTFQISPDNDDNDDSPMRLEVDLYEELKGRTLSCRHFVNQPYPPRMFRLFNLLVLLLATSWFQTVTLSIGLWITSISVYLLITAVAGGEYAPRLTTCARLLAMTGMCITGASTPLDWLRGLAFAYWFGEGILRDMSVLPPQSSPSWFALPLLIMIINKYMMDYIIVHPLVSQVPFGLVIAFMWMRWMLDVAAGAWFVTRVVTPDNDNRRQ